MVHYWVLEVRQRHLASTWYGPWGPITGSLGRPSPYGFSILGPLVWSPEIAMEPTLLIGCAALLRLLGPALVLRLRLADVCQTMRQGFGPDAEGGTSKKPPLTPPRRRPAGTAAQSSVGGCTCRYVLTSSVAFLELPPADCCIGCPQCLGRASFPHVKHHGWYVACVARQSVSAGH